MADKREVAKIVVGEVVRPDTPVGRVLRRTVEDMEGLEPGTEFEEIRRRMVQKVNEKAGTNIKLPDLEALGDDYFRSKSGKRNRFRLIGSKKLRRG